MKRCGNQDALDIGWQEAQRRRDEAHQACLKARKEAGMWRRDYLQELADAIAETKKEEPAQVLKNLRHRETQRNRAQRIKPLSAKQKGGKVMKLYHTVDGA